MSWLQNKIISAFADIRLKIIIFQQWKLAWNYFTIISEPYCSSWLFFIMLSVSDIILIWSLLCANVYDILRRCRRPLVVSNALTQSCISCFIPDIHAVKVDLRLGIHRKKAIIGPPVFGGRGYSRFFTSIFKAHSLSSIWSVLVEFRSASSEGMTKEKRWKNLGKTYYTKENKKLC